ncbi:MAG: hypothetical protein ACLQVK_26990 [Acidimicrobiales bacterium]
MTRTLRRLVVWVVALVAAGIGAASMASDNVPPTYAGRTVVPFTTMRSTTTLDPTTTTLATTTTSGVVATTSGPVTTTSGPITTTSGPVTTTSGPVTTAAPGPSAETIAPTSTSPASG